MSSFFKPLAVLLLALLLEATQAQTPSTSPSVSSQPSQPPTTSSQPSVSSQPSQPPTVSIQPSWTLLPTAPPSGTPSVSSKPSTSQTPTSVPTLSNAPSVSSIPSLSPSAKPSIQPSVSMQPSQQPTVSIQPTLSMRPTQTGCFVTYMDTFYDAADFAAMFRHFVSYDTKTGFLSCFHPGNAAAPETTTSPCARSTFTNCQTLECRSAAACYAAETSKVETVICRHPTACNNAVIRSVNTLNCVASGACEGLQATGAGTVVCTAGGCPSAVITGAETVNCAGSGACQGTRVSSSNTLDCSTHASSCQSMQSVFTNFVRCGSAAARDSCRSAVVAGPRELTCTGFGACALANLVFLPNGAMVRCLNFGCQSTRTILKNPDLSGEGIQVLCNGNGACVGVSSGIDVGLGNVTCSSGEGTAACGGFVTITSQCLVCQSDNSCETFNACRYRPIPTADRVPCTQFGNDNFPFPRGVCVDLTAAPFSPPSSSPPSASPTVNDTAGAPTPTSDAVPLARETRLHLWLMTLATSIVWMWL